MKLENCKDFADILVSITNYGVEIKEAKRKVWSAKKYRQSDDIIYARKAYPQHEAIIDKLTIG